MTPDLQLQAGTPVMIAVMGGTETPGLASLQPPFVVLRGPLRFGLRGRAVVHLGPWLALGQADVDPLALSLAGLAPPAALGWAGVGRAFEAGGGAVSPWLGAGGLATATGRGWGPAVGVLSVGTTDAGPTVYASAGAVWPTLLAGDLADPGATGTWPAFDLTLGLAEAWGPGRFHLEAALRAGTGVRPLVSGAAPTTDGTIIALLGVGYAPGAVTARPPGRW